jgi:hypothetical protein
MLKRILFATLLTINTCHAKELTTYTDIISEINKGARLTFVTDWDMCKGINPNGNGTKANFTTAYTPDGYFISKNGFILVRGATIAQPIAAFPQLGLVTQTFAYLLKADGTLHAINRFIDPATYKEIAKPVEADCQLGEGFKVFG